MKSYLLFSLSLFLFLFETRAVVSCCFVYHTLCRPHLLPRVLSSVVRRLFVLLSLFVPLPGWTAFLHDLYHLICLFMLYMQALC